MSGLLHRIFTNNFWDAFWPGFWSVFVGALISGYIAWFLWEHGRLVTVGETVTADDLGRRELAVMLRDACEANSRSLQDASNLEAESLNVIPNLRADVWDAVRADALRLFSLPLRGRCAIHFSLLNNYQQGRVLHADYRIGNILSTGTLSALDARERIDDEMTAVLRARASELAAESDALVAELDELGATSSVGLTRTWHLLPWTKM